MQKTVTPKLQSAQPFMTLENLAGAAPIPATEEMPSDIQALLNQTTGLYVSAKQEPKLNFSTEKVPGAPGIWKVVGGSDHEQLRTTIPGREQTELDVNDPATAGEMDASTEGYRPPWAQLDYLPRLSPFRVGEDMMFEPLAQEERNRLHYPWRTVGIVFSSNGSQGSGVLVGENLLLTAGHVAPWGSGAWHMEFVPAYRIGDRPFGSSFVEAYRGFNTSPEVSGKDYVICKLYNPLGRALGWMGTKSFGSEEEYKRRRYVSSGYPGSFGTRPAVELDMGIRDIDSDSPGIELEFANRADLGSGWSGGPLWLPGEGPSVAGVLSGTEKDEFDPRRLVFAGGGAMVDLVRFGLTNWRP